MSYANAAANAAANTATNTAGNATAASDAAAHNIESITLHPFDVNDHSVWIYQAASIFLRKNITNPVDNYDIIFAQLSTNIISSLSI
jgi:hypothetical protein